MKSILRNIVILIVIALIVCIAGFYLYTQNPSKADTDIRDSVLKNTSLEITENDAYFKIKRKGIDSDKGVIFYPGGKVEPDAYLQNLSFIALTTNSSVYIAKMPFNLAIFGINAAETIINNEKEIEVWFLGGHSMGGAMACEYAASNPSKIVGLFLMGSYCNRSISEVGFKVLSISGENDGLLPKAEVEQYSPNLPSNKTITFIQGMTHAQFGDYGLQSGDGKATITNDEADIQIVTTMIGWLN